VAVEVARAAQVQRAVAEPERVALAAPLDPPRRPEPRDDVVGRLVGADQDAQVTAAPRGVERVAGERRQFPQRPGTSTQAPVARLARGQSPLSSLYPLAPRAVATIPPPGTVPFISPAARGDRAL